jgi:hypothetical protein
MRSGVTLASSTPREVGTCLVGKSLPALLPRLGMRSIRNALLSFFLHPICWQGHAHAAAGR